jgi:integrase
MKDWDKAQRLIRQWEAQGNQTAAEKPPITVGEACKRFVADATARQLAEATRKKYAALFRQLQEFCRQRGIRFLEELDLSEARAFRESWRDSGISALKKLERLRSFLRFALETGWIAENPAKKLANPKVSNQPTLPFDQQEVIDILAACQHYPDNYGNTGGVSAIRLRALVLFLRYSGMRIGDAATCAIDRLRGNRVFLYTQKTGVPVNVRLPDFVVDALNSMPPVSRGYFFWTGEGSADTVAGNWRRSLRKLFRLAGISGGHPHRFRDTFAVELLMAGTPLDRVSVLLGHSSVRITERHYAPWIRGRQEQLEADLERSWAADRIVLAETKGTPEVHGKMEVVN